ncbi:L,D-transpeptidase family protein [Conexibacter woesei]|uniref:ErfK/YbiS/YcfS/YnhG family protein n=1 Tax=Conexibacter woesei (strain DSM 14684 / CCUG 47730 / CIP 108061 / JCM 11494 / NBRC 100937 / ID131577) TaxID=469383 RepID=D3F1C0_CONWI|nr:L,D-transpeptidase family protein [Conexibacter woesei]ADB52083.1 ErfK/YbiS/YcfS/YnhG family protein [Conexibacter woesei DSM 14684]
MRSRRFLIVAVFVVLLLSGAVGAYAYDHSQRDTIANGVAVGGVDVGGLEPAEARTRLQQELVEPLREPVVVTFEKRRFVLSPRQARVAVDLDGMVTEAVERSRRSSFFARVGRSLTGGSLDADLRPQVTYDPKAVDRFVGRVAERLDRAPKDATVAFAGSSLGEVAGQDGVDVDSRRLRRGVARALRRTDDARTVKVRAAVVRPKVTTAQLAKQYPVVITVDRAAFRLSLWKNLRLAKSYTVAIGQIGLDTPAGLYEIQNKAVDPVWSVPNSAWAGDLAGTTVPPGPSNPIKARWLGIFDGAGIHGTDAVYSLGTAASHGCVRMAIPDVIELYDQTPVGAPIYIA